MDTYTRKRDTGEPTRNTGEFGSKPQHTPEVSLGPDPVTARLDPRMKGTDPRRPLRVFADALVSGRGVTRLHPRGLTRTRAALRNARGERDGAIRVVKLDWASTPPGATVGASRFEVHGPRDGRPIIVTVDAGCPPLTVASGHAIICGGGNGFGVEVAPGAHATVIILAGSKVGVEAHSGATVDLHPEPSARGFWTTRSDATFRVHGADDVEVHVYDPR